MRIRFTGRAVSDLEEAAIYYDGAAADLGEQFLDQLDRVVDRVQAFPNSGSPVEGFPQVRRARTKQFPYGIFYRVDGEDVIVLRVLHARRDIDQNLGRSLTDPH